jgi:hypothetical protein
MKLKSFVFLIVFSIFNFAFSQKNEPELTINLLANDKISSVNIDQDKFISSIGLITEYCKKNLNNLPVSQKIGILVIVHKNGNPTFKCYSKPKISNELQTKILTDLNLLKIENTKLVDFPIFISVNSKNNGEITDFDDYIDPTKQKLKEYADADIQTKLKLNKEFAINEVLPVLAAYQVIVDDKFEGVKTFGKLVQKTNFNQAQDIESLTSKYKNYWRAILEMDIGNQLIPVTKIFAFVSQGELDHAKKYLEIIQMFSDPKTIPNDYLRELSYRLDLFENQLNKEIEKGIIEHDKGNYKSAIKIYSEILKNYPNSAWALYEKYYSENAIKLKENKSLNDDRKDWDLAKVEIYKHNPLYNMDIIASNGKEAYLLFRRQEIATLFKKKEDRLQDIFKYAEIATDLGVYDFAAQLFWILATNNKVDSESAIYNYLYCLEKLGVTEIKSNFKGNFEKIFKSIEEDKENEMKKSSIYKSMKN